MKIENKEKLRELIREQLLKEGSSVRSYDQLSYIFDDLCASIQDFAKSWQSLDRATYDQNKSLLLDFMKKIDVVIMNKRSSELNKNRSA